MFTIIIKIVFSKNLHKSIYSRPPVCLSNFRTACEHEMPLFKPNHVQLMISHIIGWLMIFISQQTSFFHHHIHVNLLFSSHLHQSSISYLIRTVCAYCNRLHIYKKSAMIRVRVNILEKFSFSLRIYIKFNFFGRRQTEFPLNSGK